MHTASTASSGLTFLHERQYPHHHIPLFHCLLCTVSTASSGLTFLHQRQCPHHHIPLFYCVHCVMHTASAGLTFLSQRTMYPPPCTTILLRTASTMSSGLTFLYQRQCPHHHIPLFYCAHCVLHTASTGFTFLHQKTMYPPPYTTILLHTASTASSHLTFLYQRQCPHHHIPLFYCVHCVLHPHH